MGEIKNEEIWLDENGKEHKLMSYNFKNINGKHILFGTFTDGKSLPLYEVKKIYKKIGLNYIK